MPGRATVVTVRGPAEEGVGRPVSGEPVSLT